MRSRVTRRVAIKKPKRALATPLVRMKVFFSVVGLFCFLAFGAGVLYAAVKWQRSLKEPVSNTNTLLAEFRELRDQGEITETEFQTIKTQLSYQIRDEMRDAERRRSSG